MLLHITEPYLWFPVDKAKPEVKLHFYLEGEKVQEIDIHLGGTDGDFYTYMDVSDFLEQDLEIQGDIPRDMLLGIFCCSEKVQNIYPFRPKLHFSPVIGWHNDPNGLVYADGWYHLYYQWNPYGVVWGNMHWGHAVSRDLLRWEHKPAAITPGELGTAYSGCGWLDVENAAGHGENALLFYYTAGGGRNQWSADAGNDFTQRLSVSTDGGNTLRHSDDFFMPHVAGENRDPKVFYHQASGAYIMVLYLDGYEFAIYRSKDLLHWKETQRFSMKGMWECPDLFELPVEHTDGEKKWVFWSADGYYVVGEFDGWHFTPKADIRMAYATKLPYAAQSYAGVGDRVISVSWLRMDNDRGNYRGLMSIPSELSLIKQGEDYLVRFAPVRELLALRQPAQELAQGQRRALLKLLGEPLELTMEWEMHKTGYTKLLLGNLAIIVDFSKEMINFCNMDTHSDTVNIPFDCERPLTIRFIIDQEVIEFFGNDGIIYGAVETEENVLNKVLLMESFVEIRNMQWCELK